MIEDFVSKPIPIEFIFELNKVEIHIKRDDLIDDQVSGNKLFKLKYNVDEALELKKNCLLTFGGAFSNHIAATAAFGKLKRLETIGIIRGDKPSNLNSTLALAIENGMNLFFVSREEYKNKDSIEYLSNLASQYPNAFTIPEGGANQLGVRGASEILENVDERFTHIATAMGTGTTFAGLVKAAQDHQQIIGFPIHKHDNLLDDILNFDPTFKNQMHSDFNIINGYHFGGYAKWNQELIEFIQSIYSEYQLKLDPVYTGKALFGLIDQIKKGKIKKGSKVLFIHTGGLQGVAGFEERFNLKLFQD